MDPPRAAGSPSKTILSELLHGAPSVFLPGIDDAPLAPTAAMELEIGDEGCGYSKLS